MRYQLRRGHASQFTNSVANDRWSHRQSLLKEPLTHEAVLFWVSLLVAFSFERCRHSPVVMDSRTAYCVRGSFGHARLLRAFAPVFVEAEIGQAFDADFAMRLAGDRDAFGFVDVGRINH